MVREVGTITLNAEMNILPIFIVKGRVHYGP